MRSYCEEDLHPCRTTHYKYIIRTKIVQTYDVYGLSLITDQWRGGQIFKGQPPGSISLPNVSGPLRYAHIQNVVCVIKQGSENFLRDPLGPYVR